MSTRDRVRAAIRTGILLGFFVGSPIFLVVGIFLGRLPT